MLMALEPETYIRQLLLWLGSTDENGLPSAWGFWGRVFSLSRDALEAALPPLSARQSPWSNPASLAPSRTRRYDYAARRGVGNYYGTNDFTLFELIHSYLRLTGDFGVLNTTLLIPQPNGTEVRATLYELTLSLVTHWRALNASGGLADYGGAPNLLECVPTYIHYVASCNAANAWMSAAFADVAEAWAGDGALAASLRADADTTAAAVLTQLYLPGAGFFGARQPNGSLTPVAHVMDHVYVTRYLGVVGAPAASGVGAGRIPLAVADEMAAWAAAQLRVPHWMRALSLLDPAAPLSNRSDHGPSGAYVGWPPLTIKALAMQRRHDEALAFLLDTAFATTLGAYGQAIEIRPPGLPYKPMDVTLYNALVAHAFSDAIITTFFGFVPLADLPGQPPTTSPLADAATPRGFDGRLSGVRWRGALYDVVSVAGTGLTLVPHA